MTILTKSKTSALWYSDTTDASAGPLEVVPAGNRVCLRSYNVYSFDDSSGAPEFITQAKFRTTSGTTDPLFFDYATIMSWYTAGMGNSTSWIEVPGDGILFDDGLFIELVAVTTRDADMSTLLQVLYS